MVSEWVQGSSKRLITANANVCDRAGTLKPRPVPYTKLYKDMKTMENTLPPPGANIMLCVRAPCPNTNEPHGLVSFGHAWNARLASWCGVRSFLFSLFVNL